MLGIFAAWAVPYLRQTAANGAGGVWLAQFQGRMEVNETFRLQNWLLNIPRGLVNYLPWSRPAAAGLAAFVADWPDADATSSLAIGCAVCVGG